MAAAARPRAGLRHAGLRLDRQPRQRRQRGRRRARDAVLRLHPGRPRGAEDPRAGRLRRATSSRSAATTTTSTACAPSSAASTRAGRSSTSTCARTTPRAPRPWPTRSPSSSASERRTASSRRSPRGSLFTKIAKGFEEWRELGLVSGELPAFNGAQALGCSPVAKAFEDGADVCRPVKPDTIAKSLAIGNPADGPYALELARTTDGGDRRRSPTTRSAPASGCWPRRPASSPRPPAA